ncbi:MAG TPA: class E sortase [bacterium]|nr:class E sortase [bacterium]
MRARRPVEVRVLAGLSTVCFIAGAAFIAWPISRILLTGYVTAEIQDKALASWEHGTGDRAGDSLVLEIPRLGVRRYVPNGATVDNLRAYGVGHISWTPFPPVADRVAAAGRLVDGTSDPADPPAESGVKVPGDVVAIAGHRTTYSAPFFRIGELGPGDVVVLLYKHRRYTYAVERQITVRPSNSDVLNGSRAELALVTCSPPYSAAFRLVVFAHLTAVAAAPASRGPISPGRVRSAEALR